MPLSQLSKQVEALPFCIRIPSTRRKKWDDCVARTSGKTYVLLLQAVSRFETFQRSFEAAGSQISQNFLIDQKVAPLPSFVQKAVSIN